jgi:hypothetical protein
MATYSSVVNKALTNNDLIKDLSTFRQRRHNLENSVLFTIKFVFVTVRHLRLCVRPPVYISVRLSTDIYSLRIGLLKIVLYTPSPGMVNKQMFSFSKLLKFQHCFEFRLVKFTEKKQKTV